MTELEEIEYREKLLKTLRLGGKVEPSEREWLVTHKAFSDIYGWPFLVMDIIELEPNRTYTVTAELLFKNCCETMMTTVSVPPRQLYRRLLSVLSIVCIASLSSLTLDRQYSVPR